MRSRRADARASRSHRAAGRGVRRAGAAPGARHRRGCAPWIEYPDTNDGKALSTLARALEARLAAALRERGLVADDARRRAARAARRRRAPPASARAIASMGSRWPLGIPRLRVPRERRRARRTSWPKRSWSSWASARASCCTPAMPPSTSAPRRAAGPGCSRPRPAGHGGRQRRRSTARSPATRTSSTCARTGSSGGRSRPVDWLVCDIVEQPVAHRGARRRLDRVRHARDAIFNLKLPMKKRHDEVARCEALIARAPRGGPRRARRWRCASSTTTARR